MLSCSTTAHPQYPHHQQYIVFLVIRVAILAMSKKEWALGSFPIRHAGMKVEYHCLG